MAMDWVTAVVPLAVLGGTLWLTGAVRRWLSRRAILDHPVHRSSHSTPVPRGGGIAVIAVAIAGWLVLAALRPPQPGTLVIAAVAAALAVLSWRDDLHGLPVGVRLLGHVLAAIAGIVALPATDLVFQGFLPPVLDHALAALLWVWFLNLYNFMDGIDGITGIETVSIGGGVALVLGIAGSSGEDAGLALAAAAAGLGFLYWNWPPAKIFLGDVGSVPLGYLLGWLLLRLAAGGLWAPALILPLYYLADASLTLLRRIARGERFWEAHRGHFYQRALGQGGDHGAVLRTILAGNLVLIAAAVFAVTHPFAAVAVALAATAIELALLARRGAAPAP